MRQPQTIDLKATASSSETAGGKPGQSDVASGAASATHVSPASPTTSVPQASVPKTSWSSAAANSAAAAGALQDAPKVAAASGGRAGEAGGSGNDANQPPQSPAPVRAGLGFSGGVLAAVIGAAAGVAGAWAVSVIRPGSIATIQQDGSLEQRLSAIEQAFSVRINTLAPKSDVTALATKVTAVDQQVAGIANEARALAARLAATPAGVEQQRAGDAVTTDGALAKQLAVLGERLSSLEQTAQQASALAGEVGAQVRTLDGVVSKIDLAPVEAASRAAAEASRRIDGLEARIGELGRSVAARTADPRVADLARAVAASDALDAIRAGRPFRMEVAVLAAGGGDAPLMSQLRAGAGGVATLARLQRDFAATGERLAAMQHQNQGVLDRLTASASRLVRVRPVDQDGKPATAAEGTVERVADMLEAGDLAGALRAWQTLPQPLRDAAPEFGAALSARVNAEQAARGALDAALASIAQGADANGVRPAQGSRP